jgi:thiosulfate/3-mercaptopyruvate sulfurtransferase
MKNIISVDELKGILNDSDLIILDATIPKVALKDNSITSEKKWIEGARFFDIKKTFSNLESNMPNTLPSPEHFEKECRRLGINNSSKIVVYDDLGIYSSPRVWWMFKTMGHANIKVLDGGLPEWMKANYEMVSQSNQSFASGNFEANFDSSAVVDFNFIQSNLENQKALVIDARSSDRFNSRVPEPRADLRSGNISRSISIPYTEVLDGGKFKSKDELESVFSELQKENRPLVFSCGSGITACVLALATSEVLENKKSIYDGSWTEYAQLSED